LELTRGERLLRGLRGRSDLSRERLQKGKMPDG